MELILGMPTYIVLDFTLHPNNVFFIYLGPSIVNVCTDHILFFNYHICLSCTYMLYVSPVVCLIIYYGTYAFVVFLYMCIV